MRLRSAILAAALFATPVAALAQPIEGLYIGAGAGLLAPFNPRISDLGRGYGVSHGSIQEGYGYSANAAVGYGLGNGFRFEIEGDFMHDDTRHLGIPTPTTAAGPVRTYGAMANAIYDLDVGLPWMYPYIGAGAGYQWTKLDPLRANGVGNAFSTGFNHQEGAFAYQGIVGASFPVPNVPGLSLTVDYRYMDITGGEKYTGYVSRGAGFSPAVLKLGNQGDQNVMIGVRYAFNTPAPAPMAPAPVSAPAPAPARSYLVFFDWDKSTLTDRARQIIKEAADNSTHVTYTRIEVNGYTDTSGTPKYNQGLSIRRAEAVAGELVRDGVPRAAITAQGFGETHLLVSTGPGVREPQNRRVEIVIR